MINRTTTVETRIRNNLDAPLTGVKVNLTIYWYDAAEGFSFDKGRIIHKDTTMVSLPTGSGELSDTIGFEWIPSHAGSYVLNISTHAPGDPRPVTHFILIGGYKYTSKSLSLTDGRWVGTNTWNASDFAGWTSFTDGADQSNGWHVSDHPLGKGYDDLHTDDGVFWAGNDTTTYAPTTGFHNLVTPMMDLTDFDPKPYDVFSRSVRPQIYFLYRYRGNISSSGPLGIGGIFHWIRYIDDGKWSDWEKLYDVMDRWINISGNTTDVIWDWSKRPFLSGDIDFVGLDLGDYQGKKVQLRFEYRPSGHLESGYVLDDLTLIGKHRVDITPFEIIGYTKEVPEIDPGSRVNLQIELRSRLTSIDQDLSLRIDCVDSSAFLDKDRDISIDPQIIDLGKDDDSLQRINVSVSVPGNAPFGSGWIKIRLIAGGLVKDLNFDLTILSRRSLTMKVQGEVEGEIEPFGKKALELVVENRGNIKEDFNLTFVSSGDLLLQEMLTTYMLRPGDRLSLNLTILISESALTGLNTGWFVLSRGSLKDKETILNMVLEYEEDPSWITARVEYQMVQLREINLYAPSIGSTFLLIEEPPEQGVFTYRFDLIVQNSGNGIDNVTFSLANWDRRDDMEIHHPSNVLLFPGEVRVIQVLIDINYPIPWGQYNFSMEAYSDSGSIEPDGSVTLFISIGPGSISEGVFLLNGSLKVEPQEIILGRESLISFTVRSFGLVDQETFLVNLWVDGKVVSTSLFQLPRSQDGEYQIPWTFTTSGEHLVNISISQDKVPYDDSGELTLEISSIVVVRYIDLYIDSVFFSDHPSDINLSSLPPGDKDMIVSIRNGGDAVADISTITLELLDRERGEVMNITLNLTEIGPGSTKELVFKNIEFKERSVYQVSILIDNNGRWKDTDVDNDLMTIDIEVGEKPPDEPLWRNSTLSVAVFLVTFLLVGIFFIYLIRKKLSS